LESVKNDKRANCFSALVLLDAYLHCMAQSCDKFHISIPLRS